MTYQNRETQKENARKLLFEATTAQQRAHAVFMLIEAYYHRNLEAPDLATYASHWLWASRQSIPQDALAILLCRYPFPKHPKIEMGFSDWNSYGAVEYRY